VIHAGVLRQRSGELVAHLGGEELPSGCGVQPERDIGGAADHVSSDRGGGDDVGPVDIVGAAGVPAAGPAPASRPVLVLVDPAGGHAVEPEQSGLPLAGGG